MTSTIQRLDTNARMSHIVIHNHVAYLAGAVATSLDQGVETQTAQALADIDASLTRVGSDRRHILSSQIWLKDLARDFAAMNTVWEAWMPAGAAPTRATCQAHMADEAILVEIIVTAAVIPA